MRVTDFDGDGDPDLILGTDVELTVYQGSEGVTFLRGIGPPLLDASVSSVVFGDFDADGTRDMAVSCAVQSCIWIYTAREGRLVPSLEVDVPAGRYLTVADLDGDGKDDLIGSGEVLWTALSSRRARRGPPPVLEGEREKKAGPVLNEILAVNNGLPVAADEGKKSDWVEIHAGVATSLAGWRLRLTDLDGSVEEFTLPPGASVGASPEEAALSLLNCLPLNLLVPL